MQYIDLDMDKGLGVAYLSHTQVGSLDSGELWQPEESSSIPMLNTSKESPCTSKESPCQFSTASRSEEPHLLLHIILYFLRSLIFWRIVTWIFQVFSIDVLSQTLSGGH